MVSFESRVCLSAVSKDGVEGELKVERDEPQKCPERDCLTLKVVYELRLSLRSHRECDQHPELDGDLRATLVVATDKDGLGRGIHEGGFEWTSGGSVIKGRMHGITNAGTHRAPVANCEPCDQKGHLEGTLESETIADGDLAGCSITASYVLDYHPNLEVLRPRVFLDT